MTLLFHKISKVALEEQKNQISLSVLFILFTIVLQMLSVLRDIVPSSFDEDQWEFFRKWCGLWGTILYYLWLQSID